MTALTSKILLLAALCARLAMAGEANEGIAIPSSLPGCTSTITSTQSRLPTPPFWPQCSWDGTLSVYSATVAVTRLVDCGGCTDVRIVEEPIVHCPAMVITAVEHVSTATTSYRTVCSATPTP